jgi:hypothetical protein
MLCENEKKKCVRDIPMGKMSYWALEEGINEGENKIFAIHTR